MTLPLAQAMASPCTTCDDTPCCTNLPLHQFTVTTLRDVDRARHLLNFDGIVLGVGSDGTWTAYLAAACRHLDVDDGTCRVHATPAQPATCASYNPYGCWYRAAWDDADHYRHVDRRRFAAWSDRLRFDEQRRVVGMPDWDELVAIVDDLPLVPPTEVVPDDDAGRVHDAWRADVLDGVDRRLPTVRTYDPGEDRCDGCAAPCCTNLVFPKPPPTSAKAMEFLRFATGFPGVDIGIGPREWSLVVSTRCRHLTDDARCGVYGQDERPLVCRYYDATSCSFAPRLGTPRPQGFVRITHEDLPTVLAEVRVDDAGQVCSLPDVERCREVVETRWLGAVTYG